MAGPVIGLPPKANFSLQGSAYRSVLVMLTSLFFMFGFITCLNDILVPHLKGVFQLNYTMALLVQSVWFLGYGVASIPSSKIMETIGYKKGMAGGLLMMAMGMALLIPAALTASYPFFLGSLFVISCGMALLQVGANPYMVVVGPPESASKRLNLAQAFNSLGTTLAPVFGSMLILGHSVTGTHDGSTAVPTTAERLADAQTVIVPYVGIAIALVVLAVVLMQFHLPDIHDSQEDSAKSNTGSLWEHRNLVLGVAAIFTYLITEIGVGSLLVSFISSPTIGNLTVEKAGFYLSLFWGGMMVGRFIGAGMMTYFRAETMLAFSAIGAFILICMAVFTTGHLAMWSLVLVGLFHSIMFPTIFSLAVRGLGPLTKRGSGLLLTAAVGGVVVSLQGIIADHFGLQISFLLPAACELFILFYALNGCRTSDELKAHKLSKG